LGLIAERVAAARAGTNQHVIARLRSGWVVIGEVQFLPGYCLLLADPVAPSLNDLSAEARIQYLRDMALVGDAILKATESFRINYEILGNSEPELHAHIFPRYLSEPEEKRRKPVWFYDWVNAVRFSEQEHGHIFNAIRAQLPSEA
jgi:diadenosine tetraphosphate (Ap4A) HIT family hydrolase